MISSQRLEPLEIVVQTSIDRRTDSQQHLHRGMLDGPGPSPSTYKFEDSKEPLTFDRRTCVRSFFLSSFYLSFSCADWWDRGRDWVCRIDSL